MNTEARIMEFRKNASEVRRLQGILFEKKEELKAEMFDPEMLRELVKENLVRLEINWREI